MSESSDTPKTRPLALVGLVISALIVGGLVLTDPHGSRLFAECMVLGKGRFVGQVPDQRFEVDYYGNTFIGTPDNVIDLSVYIMGAWEREMVSVMEDILELTDPGGGVVVDIGANVGTHSIYMSDHAATVHAVEPWPTVLDRMSAMLEKSSIDNVVIHPVGFAPEEGTMPFTIPPADNLGMGSFSNSMAEHRKLGKETLELPLVVADEYLARKAVDHVDMVKIDIEGYEKGALLGMAKTLERDRPVIIIELNVENQEGFHSEEELRSAFPENYVFYELTAPTTYMWDFGSTTVACSNHAGRYQLEPFAMEFEVDGANLVALPQEVAGELSKLPERASVR